MIGEDMLKVCYLPGDLLARRRGTIEVGAGR
jgi:hypothetical protein